MTFTAEREKKINYAGLSFLFAIICIAGLVFTMYMFLKWSGYPLVSEEVFETIEDRKLAGEVSMEFVRKSLFYHIPIYLISLGLFIMFLVKKQRSKLKGILSFFHGFVVLTFLYQVISK